MTLPDRRLLRLLPLASLVLTACSIHAPKGPGKSPDSPQWRQHQQEVRNLSQYQTRGAFAYISDSQKVYARFFWQQTGQDNYRLLLTNPLGSTELELNVQKNVVQLTDNQGKRYVSDNPEEMIRKLTYQQGGQTWKVDYQGYSNEVQPTLPNRLELQQGDQRIKLKMDNWTLK